MWSKRHINAALFFVMQILLLCAVGCAVGPSFTKPHKGVPPVWDGFNTAVPLQKNTAVSRPVELVQWWKIFNDATLTTLVEKALDANLDLRMAAARVRQARAARIVAVTGLLPSGEALGSYRRSYQGKSTSGTSGKNSVTSGNDASDSSGYSNNSSASDNNTTNSDVSGGTTSAQTTGSLSVKPHELDLFQVGMDAIWEIDIFGGVRRGVEAAHADLQTAIEDLRDMMVTLIAEVGTTYISLRGYQQQIAITRKNLEAQQRTAEITRKRFRAGFISGLDVANAETLASATQAQIPVLESAARQAIYSLSVLLNLEPAALEQELSQESPLPNIPQEIPVGLPSELLRRRPDIRRAEAQIHAATARIGVAIADLFPKFSLTGSFVFKNDELNALGNWGNRVWTWGPDVKWPIFDAGRIYGNIKIQNALQEQALATYEMTVLTALKDVETALVAFNKEQQHYASLWEAVASSRRAADLSMRLYTAGRTDFLNVLIAQRSLYTYEDALVQSNRSLATNLVALYKALGGGWEQ